MSIGVDINGTFSNGYLQLVFNKTNHVIALKNDKTGESMDLFLKFTEVYEKKSTIFEVPDSVCDGSNVYTYVPDKGSTPLLPANEVNLNNSESHDHYYLFYSHVMEDIYSCYQYWSISVGGTASDKRIQGYI